MFSPMQSAETRIKQHKRSILLSVNNNNQDSLRGKLLLFYTQPIATENTEYLHVYHQQVLPLDELVCTGCA